MRQETGLPGLMLVHGHRSEDSRGAFRKVIDRESALGTVDEVALSHNARRGTLRGLHFQAEPHAQAKTVFVTAGSVLDVVVDVRADSPTFGQWRAFELSDETDLALHVPRGFAHGFQTTADHTVVAYLMAGAHAPEQARTLRWDDPDLAITWPLPVAEISENDARAASWEDLWG